MPPRAEPVPTQPLASSPVASGLGGECPSTAPARPADRAAPRPRWRALLDRLRATPADPQAASLARLRRLEEAVRVLEATRGVLERGWVQGTWYVVPSRGPRLVLPTLPPVAGRDEVSAACLVGAVVYAAGQVDAKAGTATWGLPLDLLWDAVREDAVPRPSRSAPPHVRALRARDLAAWNDAAGRTHDEVLRVVDVAVAGAIQQAMTVRTTADAGHDPVEP